jgi:uncharacterized protein YbjT (DUF2867 family)
MPSRRVFITGGTGYLGSRLITLLAERGCDVRALARSASATRLPRGCRPVIGDPLDGRTFADQIQPGGTFIQLVGVPKPAPWKGEQFRAVDLVSGLTSIDAATRAGVSHFIYVSVAHPAPIMKDYIAVRSQCETALRATGLRATILRPWYILGPGHWWPLLLKPAYWIYEQLPSTRESALRLGLVTLQEMLASLIRAVEHPPESVRVIEVPEIRAIGKGLR